MSTQKNKRHEASDARKAKKYDLIQSASRATGTVRWVDVKAELITMAINAVTEDGDAIILSKTTDGGALVITLLMDKDRAKIYCTTEGEANVELEGIIDAYRS